MRIDERVIGDLFLERSGGRTQIDERIVGDVVIAAVTGDITVNGGGDVALKDKMGSVIQQGHRKLLVDLGGVPYMDSTGLAELVRAYVAAKNVGGSLKLLRPTQHLQELLRITKLATVFDSYEDEATALTSFSAAQV